MRSLKGRKVKATVRMRWVSHLNEYSNVPFQATLVSTRPFVHLFSLDECHECGCRPNHVFTTDIVGFG